MRRTKRKSKEIKSSYYSDSSFIRPQPSDKSSTSLNHVFFRSKQLPPVIDPQLQNAIQKASMVPSCSYWTECSSFNKVSLACLVVPCSTHNPRQSGGFRFTWQFLVVHVVIGITLCGNIGVWIDQCGVRHSHVRTPEKRWKPHRQSDMWATRLIKGCHEM